MRSRTALVVGVAVVVVFGLWTVPTVASHLTVRSKDIVNGHVKTPDVATGAVTKRKVRNGAIAKSKLAPSARVMWAVVNTEPGGLGAGVIVAQSGGITVVDQGTFAGQRLRFPRSVQGKAIVATPITSTLGSPDGASTVKVAPCGPGPLSGPEFACGSPGSVNELVAIGHNGGAQNVGVDYYIAVLP
jgi:hypothetical protein